MIKHIGIVACSAEGAALCYRTICIEAAQFVGEHNHPEITMHTYPLSDYMAQIQQGSWEGVAQLMLSSVGEVAKVGAEFAIGTYWPDRREQAEHGSLGLSVRSG